MPKKETVISTLKEIRDLLKGGPVVLNKSAVKARIQSGEFIDNNDGTITDISTGLMWVKNPHTDLPKIFKDLMNWKDAIQACKDLHFAGHKDWHLPTVEELRSIVDYTKGAKSGEPAIDTAFFPDTKCSWYWTSTPAAWPSDGAWFVGFGSGFVYYYGKDVGSYVRPVRASK